MPKKKTPKSVLVRQWTSGSQCHFVDGETVFCHPCGKQVPCEKKCHLEQHDKTTLHQANALRNQPSTSRQSFLSEASAEGKRKSIQKLESSGAALTQNVELILDVQERFATVPNGPVADRVTSKLKAVLDKNPGFYVLKQVSNVLSGADSKIPGAPYDDDDDDD
ncbi:hypothetical protein HPB50_007962 [Hyalomma asiaticum]|uniref:Uncharacterized protein n=1 Tax=Hyalomma asiaticum TaxID=266040 RepID=A0ACB7S502_HYAAI|nr:hypothetical protein HPB50_007962 [Hyalomma asiaticum]